MSLFKDISLWSYPKIVKITGQSAIGGSCCGLFVNTVKWGEIPANSSGCIVYIRFRECETVNTNTFHFFAQNRYFFEIRNHYPDFANIAVNAAKRAGNNV